MQENKVDLSEKFFNVTYAQLRLQDSPLKLWENEKDKERVTVQPIPEQQIKEAQEFPDEYTNDMPIDDDFDNDD